MKKKTTRKIRRNKRATTQWRKNRSYKRMRGGAWRDKSKIVKLLTNLIINNLPEADIRKLCQQQSLPKAEQPLLPKAEQPLLPTAEQPLVLKKAKKVNEELIKFYESIINPTQNTGKFEYKFDAMTDLTTKSIIEALKTKGISYFDILVSDKRTVAILSPEEFKKALTVPGWNEWFVGPKDVLVYSMFALAGRVIIYKTAFNKESAKIDLTEPVCPPIADI